jgi:hypothetical protein
MVGQRQQALTIRFRQQQNRSDTKLANVFASTLPIQKGSGACPLRLRSIVTLELDRIVVVPDRKPDPTDQLRQGIPRRQSHIDGASGIDREPTGGLSDGEETAHALDHRGAQMLLHARCALLNVELVKYTLSSPSESSQVLAVAA